MYFLVDYIRGIRKRSGEISMMHNNDNACRVIKAGGPWIHANSMCKPSRELGADAYTLRDQHRSDKMTAAQAQVGKPPGPQECITALRESRKRRGQDRLP